MRSSGGVRFIIAIIVAIGSLVGYFASREFNPVTAEMQSVGMSQDQEVALGLKAAPELAQQFGGLSRDSRAQALVDRVGQRIVSQTSAGKTDYRFDFHVLDDDRTINAMALPGGQVFITEALLRKLDTEGELAGVLGHEIAHVVARHGAEHLAKARLMEGLGGAAVIATYDPDRPGASYTNQAVAAAIGQLVNMRFGREDEIESDRFGVRFMADAGYDPRSMLRVMKVLAESGKGQGRAPEFFTTHPSPDRRMERIKQAIQETYPNGLPSGLVP